MSPSICNKCNKEKEMYYKEWCPRCDKPEVKKIESLNLIQVLRYLECNGYPGIKDRIWAYCADIYNFHNDSSFYLGFPDPDIDSRIDYENGVYDDLMTIKNSFNIEDDGILMDVSW